MVSSRSQPKAGHFYLGANLIHMGPLMRRVINHQQPSINTQVTSHWTELILEWQKKK